MAKTTNDKTLDQVLSDIEKQFGKGAVMKLGEREHQKGHQDFTEEPSVHGGQPCFHAVSGSADVRPGI